MWDLWRIVLWKVNLEKRIAASAAVQWHNASNQNKTIFFQPLKEINNYNYKNDCALRQGEI